MTEEQNITSLNYEALQNTGKLMVLDFWATWCGPCRKMAPIVEALAEDYEGQAIIGKCNIEEDEELPERFGIMNIPTILFLRNGQILDKVIGAVPRSTLEEKLKTLLNN